MNDQNNLNKSNAVDMNCLELEKCVQNLINNWAYFVTQNNLKYELHVNL